MMEEKCVCTADEARRTAYMLAWRDRYIERLREVLAGREEERRLLGALLAAALSALVGEVEGVRAEEAGEDKVLHIAHRAVSERLDSLTLLTERDAEEYRIRFLPVKGEEGEHGAAEKRT